MKKLKNPGFPVPPWAVYAPVVPSTFDNSWSIVEMISKLIHYCNIVNENCNSNTEEIESLRADLTAFYERLTNLENTVIGFDDRIEIIERNTAQLIEVVANLQGIIEDLPDFENFMLKSDFAEWVENFYTGDISRINDRLEMLENTATNQAEEISDINDALEGFPEASEIMTNSSFSTWLNETYSRDNAIIAEDIARSEATARSAVEAAPIYITFNRISDTEITTTADFDAVKARFMSETNNSVIAKMIFDGKTILLSGCELVSDRKMRFVGFSSSNTATEIVILDWDTSSIISKHSIIATYTT